MTKAYNTFDTFKGLSVREVISHNSNPKQHLD